MTTRTRRREDLFRCSGYDWALALEPGQLIAPESQRLRSRCSALEAWQERASAGYVSRYHDGSNGLVRLERHTQEPERREPMLVHGDR